MSRTIWVIALAAVLAGGSLSAATYTVTNTLDASPGSLRQALLDANSAAGPDEIVFDIPLADPGFNGQWWTISLVSVLPQLDDSVHILGFTQTANRGDTNPGQIGSGGTVGVDSVPLVLFDRPEIAIHAGGNDGLNINPLVSDILIEGLAIIGARDGIEAFGISAFNCDTLGEVAGTNRVVRDVVIGVMPDGTDPGVHRLTRDGIFLRSSGSTTASCRVELDVGHVLVRWVGRHGLDNEGRYSSFNVTASEISDNGSRGVVLDGVDGSVTSSLIRGNGRHGIQLGSEYAPGALINQHLIENNTVMGSANVGVLVRRGSYGNTVSQNVISGNQVGIAINTEDGVAQTDDNVLTENSISGNAMLGIDLVAGINSSQFDGVTLNDPGDIDTGSNELQNFPVIERASLTAGQLTVDGFCSAGATVELFVADPDPTGFGEGVTWLATFVEGTADDLDPGSGSYGPDIDGLTVATAPVTSERFSFVFAAPDGVGGETVMTATETVGRNTSEFGPPTSIEAAAIAAVPATSSTARVVLILLLAAIGAATLRQSA